MYIVTVTYPNGEGATFDHDYYRQTHLPMAGRAFAPHGLDNASVLRGESAVDGSPPTYLLQAIFSFRDEAGARAAVAAPETREVIADITNFTNVAPVIQYCTAIL